MPSLFCRPTPLWLRRRALRLEELRITLDTRCEIVCAHERVERFVVPCISLLGLCAVALGW